MLVVCGTLQASELQQPNLVVEATAFYLTAYVVISLAAFALLSIISNRSEADTIADIQGLFWRHPILALLLTVAMLSLAGIPLTAGFIGKFYLFTVGIKGSLWLLFGALVIGRGIGIYYYLRLVFAMTTKTESPPAPQTGLSWVAKIVTCLLLFIMLYFGILPQPLIEHLGGLSV